jgi:hypothetical protein
MLPYIQGVLNCYSLLLASRQTRSKETGGRKNFILEIIHINSRKKSLLAVMQCCQKQRGRQVVENFHLSHRLSLPYLHLLQSHRD